MWGAWRTNNAELARGRPACWCHGLLFPCRNADATGTCNSKCITSCTGSHDAAVLLGPHAPPDCCPGIGASLFPGATPICKQLENYWLRLPICSGKATLVLSFLYWKSAHALPLCRPLSGSWHLFLNHIWDTLLTRKYHLCAFLKESNWPP